MSAPSEATLARLPFAARGLEALERWLPGLADRLSAHPLAELEAPGNPGIGYFEDAGGAGLLVPASYGGRGAGARDAVAVQFALGRLAPSTAVAVTMHQFTVATLVELVRETSGMEWLVINAVATQGLIVASGFAEGDPRGKVLSPSMTLVADGPSYRLSGSKRPCSLAHSMDMITVSVRMPPPSDEFAVALVPASGEGVRVEPFWQSPVLAGAETATVVFDSVSVPRAALSYVGATDDVDRTQARGYVWFELCIAASYLGIATALVERVPAERVRDDALVAMGSELAGALAALEAVAARVDDGEGDDALLVDTLLVRYAVERATQRATDLAFELAGVAPLAGDGSTALLLASSRALSYHPPSRRRAEAGIARYLRGGDLRLEE